MSKHEVAALVVQRRHCAASVPGVPVQRPGLPPTSQPTRAVPSTIGRAVFNGATTVAGAGAGLVTTRVASDQASTAARTFVAVYVTRSERPTSAATGL